MRDDFGQRIIRRALGADTYETVSDAKSLADSYGPDTSDHRSDRRHRRVVRAPSLCMGDLDRCFASAIYCPLRGQPNAERGEAETLDLSARAFLSWQFRTSGHDPKAKPHHLPFAA